MEDMYNDDPEMDVEETEPETDLGEEDEPEEGDEPEGEETPDEEEEPEELEAGKKTPAKKVKPADDNAPVFSRAKLTEIVTGRVARAERQFVRLRRSETVSETLGIVLNRISDLCFVMARFEAEVAGK